MIRKVVFTVDEQLHVSPTAPQEAGVQGDDGATEVIFKLPMTAEEQPLFYGYDFYLEMTDAAGNYDITKEVTVSGSSVVSYILPAAWTQCGGPVQLRLVVKNEGSVAYAFEAKIILAKRAAAKLTLLPKFKELVFDAIEKCKEAIAAAKAAAASGANALGWSENARHEADTAQIYSKRAAQSADLAEGKAAVAAIYANAAEEAADAVTEAKSVCDAALANANEALEKSSEANGKYTACVEATAAANQAAADASAVRSEVAAGGFIESLKEQNAGAKFKVWVGTQAEYTALSPKPNNTLCIITDDAEKNSIHVALTELQGRDYIVDQGASGIWSYRKWASGTAECWCSTEVNYSEHEGAGSGIEDLSVYYKDLTFPFAFASPPAATCSIKWTTSEWVQAEAGTTSVRVRRFCNSNSYTNAPTTQTSVYAIGAWTPTQGG